MFFVQERGHHIPKKFAQLAMSTYLTYTYICTVDFSDYNRIIILKRENRKMTSRDRRTMVPLCVPKKNMEKTYPRLCKGISETRVSLKRHKAAASKREIIYPQSSDTSRYQISG